NTECHALRAIPIPLQRNRSLQIARPSHRKSKGAPRVSNQNHTLRKSERPLRRLALRTRNYHATVWTERALCRRRSSLEVGFAENIGTSVPARAASLTTPQAHRQ